MKTVLYTVGNSTEQAEITIARSDRENVMLLPADGRHFTLTFPEHFTDNDIETFIRERHAWIDTIIHKVRKHEKEVLDGIKLSAGEINRLSDQTLPVMMQLVNEYIPIVRCSVNKLNIKAMRTRWVSCTASGTLTLNGLLVQAPDHVRRYVVVQGLCQLLGKYNVAQCPEPSQFLPDCQKAELWLKTEGRKLLSMIPEKI